MPRLRAVEFIRFPRLIDRRTPAERDLHLILDTYAARKTKAVRNGLLAATLAPQPGARL